MMFRRCVFVTLDLCGQVPVTLDLYGVVSYFLSFKQHMIPKYTRSPGTGHRKDGYSGITIIKRRGI